MNNDPKSTNVIRLIAQEVAHRQAEVCDAKRENLITQIEGLSEATKANTDNITALTLAVTSAVTSLTATVTPMVSTVKEHGTAIGKLKSRPALLAGIGALIGGSAPLIIELLRKGTI